MKYFELLKPLNVGEKGVGEIIEMEDHRVDIVFNSTKETIPLSFLIREGYFKEIKLGSGKKNK